MKIEKKKVRHTSYGILEYKLDPREMMTMMREVGMRGSRREREREKEPITTISFHFEAEDEQLGSQSLIKFTSRLQEKKFERSGGKHSARNQSINQSINQAKVRAPKKLVLLSLSLSLSLFAGWPLAHIFKFQNSCTGLV